MGFLISLSKPATIGWLETSEWGLLIFGLAVFVGILGEIKLERGSKRYVIAEYVVLFGILGELIADGGVFLFSTQLQTVSDSENARLNKEAGEARREAGTANDRAGKAAKGAADANDRAAANEKEAATLRKRAEDDAMARVKIEEGIAWRRLTKEQGEALGSRLKGFPKQIARLMYNVNDVESFNFASTVAVALQLAEWNVAEPQPVLKMAEGPVPIGTNPVLVTGVRVISTEDKQSLDAAKAILDGLLRYGFDASKSEPDKRPVRVITLWFEPRPEGPQGAAKLRAEQKQ